ncbi:hypothetical protein ACFXPQ_04975 [Streptomyces lydicus]|uniref:hypothetical protein n=1 Tax=Streptomyces lydicus TaxID=47763 RepID=UPI00368BD78A
MTAHPAVLHAELSVCPGDLVHPPREPGDRAGFVVGAGTPAEARRPAVGLAGSVGFRMAPEPGPARSAKPARPCPSL